MNAHHRPLSSAALNAVSSLSSVPHRPSPSMPYPVHVGRTDFPMKPTARAWPTPASRVAKAKNPSFVLLDGPPYANGALHLGHVLNKHVKDALVRAAQARGHTVRWQPGWDCHGLPVELNVERQGVPRTPVGPFLHAARTYAAGQVELQRTTFAEQGLCADWDRPYRTMDPKQEAATLNVFADLVQRDQVEVRHAPTWWCPACSSTLASAEHEERARSVRSCFVAFALLDRDHEVLLAWTTTAWTVPYHQGLVLNPSALYVAVHQTDRPSAGRAWVAQDALASLKEAFPSLEPVQDVAAQTGQDMVGWRYQAPLNGHESLPRTVVADASVQPAGGTGVLHVVPAFGHDDALLGQRFDWPMTHAVGPDGRFTVHAWAPHQGLDVPAAQALTLLALTQDARTGPWFVERSWTQEHPHCWRHKTPLMVRPSRQVYLRLDEPVRARATAMLERVTFVPESGRARLMDAVNKRPDWCLSRQRSWGVPVALFVHRETGRLHPCAVTVMRRVAARVAHEGVLAWWSTDDDRWFQGLPEALMLAHPLRDYERVNDVLDVWFDSGCVHRTTLAAGQVPNVVVEGHDQHRGWFQSSLWVAAALGNDLPYRTVVTHGFVVQADGRKLSKSEGGDAASDVSTLKLAKKPTKERASPPMPVWSELPSDVVRVWALQSACHLDKVWGPHDVRLAQDTYAKLRNSVRFGLANLPAAWLTTLSSTAYDARRWWPMDRWAVTQSHTLRDNALAAFEAGHVEQGVQALHRLANEVLSKGLYAWQKDRLYCAALGSPEREAALQALHVAWFALAQGLWVLAPNLMAEVEQHLGAPLQAPVWVPESLVPTAQETVEWARALAVRQALHEAWAQQTVPQGGSLQMARARLSVPPDQPVWSWSGPAVLEALGVSGLEMVHETSSGPSSEPASEGRPLSVVLDGWRAGLSVARMDGEVCPRCRWVSPLPLRDGVCERCHDRHRTVDDGAGRVLSAL